MKILRESRAKGKWLSETQLKESFYNISEKCSSGLLYYNSASGAIVIIEYPLSMFHLLTLDEIRVLFENGFLVEKNMDEFQKYLSYISFYPKKNTNYFTIIPTTACNARCFYCYEEKYCKKSISGPIHDKVVDYLTKQINGQKEFVLDWYGGEPLLCIKEIDQIILDLKERNDLSEKKWYSSITTNGTLFDSDLVNHAVKDWHLNYASITIDGIEEEHNIRKNINLDGQNAFKNTYNAIIMLLNAGVYVNLRIHLDNKNKESFPIIIKEISDFFAYDNFHLFPTFLFPPEFEMPDSYIKDYQKEELFYNIYKELFNSEYRTNILSEFPWPKNQNCFATKENTIVIAPDGSLHSCVQEFSPSDKYPDKKFCDYSSYCIECRKCRFFPICLCGCIHNHNLVGTVRTPCVRNKYIIHPLLKLLSEQI